MEASHGGSYNCINVAHRFHSAAHGASALGSIEMLKLLSAHKGQLWLNSSGGESPIHEAALAKHNGEYCERLPYNKLRSFFSVAVGLVKLTECLIILCERYNL